jgi:glycosyltransferase involved in cell wall biosynthesis
MKIVHLVPGSGSSFYCENCIRDGVLLRALNRFEGTEAILVPIYLPPASGGAGGFYTGPLFFGAVNLYLKERFPRMGNLFSFLDPLFEPLLDSGALLSFASRKAGTVRSSGHESMTISMLEGSSPFFRKEEARLVQWLKSEVKPDIIHLSNALMSGFAPVLQEELSVPVLCTLQDEDTWIDAMAEPWRSRAWNLLKEKASSIDLYLPVSRWYKEMMMEKLSLPGSKLKVLYPGIDTSASIIPEQRMDGPPVIGFLSRLCPQFGLDILVDAYLYLRQSDVGRDAILRVSGGYTKDDDSFVKKLVQKVSREGGVMEVLDHFGPADRASFLSSLTLLSVPAPVPEAFGLFLIEAMACGVPLIMPDHGGYREIMEISEGGVLLKNLDAPTLAGEMERLLSKPEERRALGEGGRKAADREFSVLTSADTLLTEYRTCSQAKKEIRNERP